MKKQILAGLVALAAGIGAGQASATTYDVTADTSVYQFLPNGNLAAYGYADLYALNTGSGHSIVTLLDFNTLDADLSSLSGSYTATLNLHVKCGDTGFGTGCPSSGAITTDILTSNSAWTETGAISWANATNTGGNYGSFTTTTDSGWISIDITSLVQYWASVGSTGDGIVLSDQAYAPVKNASNQFVALTFDAKESGLGAYINVQAVPVPAAAWLFGPTLLGLAGVSRARKAKA
jgi:hypothetical protein